MRAPLAAVIAIACGTPPAIPDDSGLRGWFDAAAYDSAISCSGEAVERCGDRCVHVWDDESACGTCDTQCGAGELCVAGECEAPVVEEAALGAGFTCVRLASGHVLCWGLNDFGQLGDGGLAQGGSEPRWEAAAVYGLDDAIAIEAGPANMCAIRGDRTVVCWGEDPYSVFFEDTRIPIELELAPGAEEVDITGLHFCARIGVEVLCSGSNASGALGLMNMDLENPIPMPLGGLPTDPPPRSVAAGGPASYGHTCVALEDGRVFCTGTNDDGQGGQPTSVSAIYGATVVSGIAGAVEVHAGMTFTCAVDAAGAVWCWGSNGSGELGNGTIGGGGQHVPQQVPGLPPVRSIALGANFALAVTEDGEEVWGWGYGVDGQLGLGSAMLDEVPSATRLVEEIGVSHRVFAGSGHACILAGGELSCAGCNADGELGLPPSDDVTTFTPVMALP